MNSFWGDEPLVYIAGYEYLLLLNVVLVYGGAPDDPNANFYLLDDPSILAPDKLDDDPGFVRVLLDVAVFGLYLPVYLMYPRFGDFRPTFSFNFAGGLSPVLCPNIFFCDAAVTCCAAVPPPTLDGLCNSFGLVGELPEK